MPTRSAAHTFTTLLAVWFLVSACGVAAPPGPPSGPPPSPPPDGVAAQLLAQVNAARASGRTCGARGAFAPTHALTLEPRLTVAAQGHADDMYARRTMDHRGGDGSSPGDRIARTGYLAASWGENVAAGYPSVDAVMAGWLGSPGHCANLMNPGFTEFGAGETERYWTQVFARPR